jgi:hypothetical protein
MEANEACPYAKYNTDMSTEGCKYDDAILLALRKCEDCGVSIETDDISDRFSDDEHQCQSKSAVKIRKRDGLRTLPTSGYSSLLPYQIPQVKNVMGMIFPEEHPKLIVDATAHIGGDILLFAKIFPNSKIIAIDNNIDAIDCLKHNIARTFKDLSRFEVFHDDSTIWIPTTKTKADLYYFDPPWGGPEYSNEDKVSLLLGGLDIIFIIKLIIEQCLSPRILLKVPRNFDFDSFKKNINVGTLRFFDIKKPQRGGCIAYSLILIENIKNI